MGSSKKSSERDREREGGSDDEKRSKKKRERGKEKSRRSRSRSRDRGKSRSRSRDRGKSRSRSRDRVRSRSRSRDRGEKGVRRKREKKQESEHRRRRCHSSDKEDKQEPKDQRRQEEGVKEEAPVVGRGSGDVVSLSIEKTNQLRAELGLKPLDVGGGGAEGKEDEAPQKKEDVHVPAKNIGDIKAAEKLKEKMETMRETRRLARKLGGVATLGGETEEESASAWVEKMKSRERERKEAEKRARLLQEMEEEFGVGELVDEALREDRSQAYTSRDLTGLKVEHETETFQEGRDTILTLKDSSILDDEGDVLVNVNMIANEKAKKNVELKKGKPAYNPYEGLDEEEDLEVKAPTVLKKYDEEIEGEKKASFTLGESGEVDTAEERERALIKEHLRAKGLTLDSTPATVASEYYTAEEMVQFRKPRKRRKIRKQLKADDLLAMGDDSSKDRGARDHGSRHSQREEVSKDEEVMEVTPPEDGGEEDLKDEKDSDFDTALVRTRRLLTRRNSAVVSGAAKVAGMLQSVPQGRWQPVGEGEGEGEGRETIVLDKTAEFCQKVGAESDEPTRRSVSSLHDDQAEEEEMEEEVGNRGVPTEEDHGGWMEVQPDMEEERAPQEEDLYQEAEPNVAQGMAAALQMASKKGFLELKKQKRDSSEVLIVQTDTQRDREYERQKERERERELSRFDRDSSFTEKKGYTPNVKIEYVDDSGRVLNTKEAFRFMSHKFHGRGSGKKKLDKRMKKIKDEHFMSRASSVDTPLNTLSMLQNKQQQAHTPYIVLSGGAHSMLAPANVMRKK